MLPPFVSRVNARTKTPVLTTLVTGGIIAILAGAVPLDVLLALVNIGTLSAFTIVCAGVLALRWTRPDAARPFRAPFAPLVAVLGAVLCLGMMIGGLSGATWIRFVVWFVAGMAVYAFYGFRTSLLRGGNGELAWCRTAPAVLPENKRTR
jgi:APA family basic amino acid/polyamine antiporter